MPMYHYQAPENLNGIVYNIGQRYPTKAEQLKNKQKKTVEKMIKLFEEIEALERQGKVMNVDFEVRDTKQYYNRDTGKYDGKHFPCPHIVMLKPVG